MRWKKNNRRDTRVVRKILLFPKCICGEFRWLELAYIKQEYGADYYDSWSNIRWATLEEYNENRYNG